MFIQELSQLTAYQPKPFVIMSLLDCCLTHNERRIIIASTRLKPLSVYASLSAPAVLALTLQILVNFFQHVTRVHCHANECWIRLISASLILTAASRACWPYAIRSIAFAVMEPPCLLIRNVMNSVSVILSLPTRKMDKSLFIERRKSNVK
jgi:hypothetical protein